MGIKEAGITAEGEGGNLLGQFGGRWSFRVRMGSVRLARRSYLTAAVNSEWRGSRKRFQ